MVRTLFVLICLLTSAPAIVHAETFTCNGVISDRPCDELKNVATRSPERIEEAKIRSQKQSMLHELRTKLIRARKEYGVDLDISQAVDICVDQNKPVEECRIIVADLDDRIEGRIAKRAAVSPTQPSKPNPLPPSSNQQIENNQVVIIQPQVAPTPTPLMVIDYELLPPWGRSPHNRHDDDDDHHHHRSPWGNKKEDKISPNRGGVK